MTSDETRLSVPALLPTERLCPFDPPAAVATLRDATPLRRLRYADGHLGWLVTGYALSRQLLADPRFSFQTSHLPVGDPAEQATIREALNPLKAIAGGMMIDKDPPVHTRLRKLQTPYFTVKAVNNHRGQIERIVNDQLEAMRSAGPPTDLVEAYAYPVASLTACALLGVPPGDRDRFEAVGRLSDDASTADKIAAHEALHAYVRSVIERKRARPDGDGILSRMVAAGELTDDELVGAAQLLFVAAHETSANQLALSVFALLHRREHWERLVDDPSSTEHIVEELLRYLTINQNDPLITPSEDVEIEGESIRAGETVMISLPAANRDPSRFANPDELDFDRDASGHLAFAYGRHMCLGQHLARLELQLSLRGLVERFPTLRLAVAAGDVPVRDGKAMFHGVDALPVTW